MLKIVWSKVYNHPLPAHHRFPMIKYDLIPEQLLHEGTITSENLFEPIPVSDHLILLTHDHDYLHRLRSLSLSRSDERKSGFPLSAALVQREILIAGGTIDCVDHAIKHGVAMNVAGGTHHAFYDRPEGFCLLNDQAIAANYLLNKDSHYKVLIVDLDVHQGNGTAALFSGEPRVLTFSMHGKNNYPFRKEVSDLDVELEDGVSSIDYLRLLEENLQAIFNRFQPNFIFYQAGVDILASDKLGKLSVDLAGCRQRDQMVISMANLQGIPLVICMGGGYSTDISQIIEAHSNTFRVVQDIFY